MAEEFLGPIIEERYRLLPEEYPNDMLSWLIEDAVGEQKDPRDLKLGVNFAAIHTTSRASRFSLPDISLVLNLPVKAFVFALYQILLSK